MSPLDWILVVIRWGHALGAVAWVGGGIFYLLVLRPARRRSPASAETDRAIGAEFRGLVHTGILVLVVTGVILSVSRLTEDAVGVAYVAVLSVKVVLALYMFYVVRFLRPAGDPEDVTEASSRWRRARGRLTSGTAVLIIGLVVFGLADLLDALFESRLGS